MMAQDWAESSEEITNYGEVYQPIRVKYDKVDAATGNDLQKISRQKKSL